MTTTVATTTATRETVDHRPQERRRSAFWSMLGAVASVWRRIGEMGDLGPGPEQSISRHLGGRI